MKTQSKTLFLTRFSILLAIEAIFCFTPLGSLPAIGPIVATLAAVPVVITAIMLGTAAGSAMGAFAGLFSFLVWTFTPPNPMFAFVFTPFYSFGEVSGNFGSLLICFVPRILIGTVTGVVYTNLNRVEYPKKDLLRFGVSGFMGSMTNTLLVMGGIYLFFGDVYSSMVGKAMLMIIGFTFITSGIPEAIISGLVAFAVCRPLQKSIQNKKK